MREASGSVNTRIADTKTIALDSHARAMTIAMTPPARACFTFDNMGEAADVGASRVDGPRADDDEAEGAAADALEAGAGLPPKVDSIGASSGHRTPTGPAARARPGTDNNPTATSSTKTPEEAGVASLEYGHGILSADAMAASTKAASASHHIVAAPADGSRVAARVR